MCTYLLPFISAANGGCIEHVLQQHEVSDPATKCCRNLLRSGKCVICSCVHTKQHATQHNTQQLVGNTHTE